jgi:hypothetical protein
LLSLSFGTDLGVGGTTLPNFGLFKLGSLWLSIYSAGLFLPTLMINSSGSAVLLVYLGFALDALA